MAYISLYRKWRPQTFAELIGQDHVAQTLTNAINNDRISHAYLFTGPRGTGKTSAAKILAKSVNCSDGPTPVPCGACDNCIQISDGTSLDVLEIDAASNRGIDEIRDLRDKVHYIPTGGRRKVYIIDEVHMLTPEAFNALLKLLEEPPSHVIFILATTEPSKVLPTIISRCQRFDFRRIRFDSLITHLKTVAGSEKIKAEPAAIELIAKQAQGGLRDALGILDQLASYTGKDILAADVTGLLGLIGSERLFQAVDLIASADTAAAFSLTGELADEGRDLRQFSKELIDHARHLFILQNGAADELIQATTEELAVFKDQAKRVNPALVRRLLDIFSRAIQEMRADGDPQFVFEAAMIRAMRPNDETTAEALIDRLERLERHFETGADITPSLAADRKIVKSESEEAMPAPAEKEPDAPEKKASAKSDGEIAPAETGSSAAPDMSAREIERFWPTIMAKIKQKNLSTQALLIECRPLAVENGKLVLGLKADWQKGLIERENNRGIIEAAAKAILGGRVVISCQPLGDASESGQAETTDAEAPVEEMLPADTAKEINGLADAEEGTLNLLMENFGAEVVKDVE